MTDFIVITKIGKCIIKADPYVSLGSWIHFLGEEDEPESIARFREDEIVGIVTNADHFHDTEAI